MAHEIGHRMAAATGGPPGGGYNHAGMPYACNCTHIEEFGGSSHCLNSREPALAAEGEAYAHFIATAVFNDRVENNGIYVYPKEALIYLAGIGWAEVNPPTWWNAYLTDNAKWYDRWMETYCPTEQAKGVELDWLRFYYELWTTGSYKFFIDEINNVWDGATDGDWGDLVDTVGEQWGNPSDKRSLFLSRGDMAGVNHG